MTTDRARARASRPDELVRRYAPLLRFSAAETHFPIDPALFVSRAVLRRYAWDVAVPDAYWNARRRFWETAALGRLPPSELVCPVIADALAGMDADAPVPAGSRGNRRPFDPDNLWGGDRAGYALELLEPLAREMRGAARDVPFLLYRHQVIGGAAGERHVLGYWFFYALHLSDVAHEGDWQEVSVSLPPDGAPPEVRFALGGRSHRADEIAFEGTHPVVHVEQGSHRGAAGGTGRDGYASSVPTWQLPLRHVAEEPWAGFDGAWGLAGQSAASTGPLGPVRA